MEIKSLIVLGIIIVSGVITTLAVKEAITTRRIEKELNEHFNKSNDRIKEHIRRFYS